MREGFCAPETGLPVKSKNPSKPTCLCAVVAPPCRQELEKTLSHGMGKLKEGSVATEKGNGILGGSNGQPSQVSVPPQKP